MKLTYFFHTASSPLWWVAFLIGLGIGLVPFLLAAIYRTGRTTWRRSTMDLLLFEIGVMAFLTVCASIFAAFGNFVTSHTDTPTMIKAITANYKVDDVQVTNETGNITSLIVTSSADHKPYTCRFRTEKSSTEHTSYFPSFDKLRQVDGTLFCDLPDGALEHK